MSDEYLKQNEPNSFAWQSIYLVRNGFTSNSTGVLSGWHKIDGVIVISVSFFSSGDCN